MINIGLSSLAHSQMYLSHHASVLPTFYVQLFCTKVLRSALCTYILGLYFFGPRILTHKLLVKLTNVMPTFPEDSQGGKKIIHKIFKKLKIR
jgi:hypothetical protein